MYLFRKEFSSEDYYSRRDYIFLFRNIIQFLLAKLHTETFFLRLNKKLLQMDCWTAYFIDPCAQPLRMVLVQMLGKTQILMIFWHSFAEKLFHIMRLVIVECNSSIISMWIWSFSTIIFFKMPIVCNIH